MSREIIIELSGGHVSVVANPSNHAIVVHDYDIDGYDEDEYEILKDKAGHRYVEREAEEI